MLIELSNLKKSYQGVDLLKNISFKINDHDKVALIGVNGAGKTTILKMILGQEEYDAGNIFINKDITIGYLAQNPDFDLNKTIYDSCLDIFQYLIDIETKLRELETKMSSEYSEAIMNQYDQLSEQFNQNGGYSYPSRIQGILKGLGFTQDEFDQPLGALSGGQKTRVSLVHLLLKEPNLLVLDEPTNHLDYKAINFLETYLKNYNKGLIVVSHDRYFIDIVANKIIEVENGKSKSYPGSYHEYALLKQEQRNIELRHYLNQQKEIKKIQKSIATLKSFNREKSIKRAESKSKQLAKIKLLDKPESLPADISINFKPKHESGFDVLKVENLSCGYQDVVFSNANFEIKRGQRVALLGENGIGKTTLFKALLHLLKPITGKIKFGSHVQISYYDQEHSNLIAGKSIFNEISDKFPKLTNTQIRSALALFNFRGENVFKDISLLSGGEKSRVVLAEILLQQANFLILDEPTNHLDIPSKEVLEEALLNFEGTIFFISHDRYFINKIATNLIQMESNQTKLLSGNYQTYLDSQTEPLKTIKEKVKYQKRRDPSQKELKNLEKEISSLEKEIAQKEATLISEEIVNDYQKYNQLDSELNNLKNKLDILLNKWEDLAS